tara:strand:- start:3288 stop:3986 length:699 start_codon:yes stop_codon:yes gene_type:complete
MTTKKIIVFGVDGCIGDFHHFQSFHNIFHFFSQTDIVNKDAIHSLAEHKTIEHMFFPLIEKSLRPDFTNSLSKIANEHTQIILYAEKQSPWLMGLIGRYLASKQIQVDKVLLFDTHEQNDIAYPHFWPITKINTHVKNFNFIRKLYPKHERIIIFDKDPHDFKETLQKRKGDIFVKVSAATKSRILHNDVKNTWITFQEHVGGTGMRDEENEFFDITKSDIMLLSLEQIQNM